MDYKEARWRELFEGFEKSFALLGNKVTQMPQDIYETASLVHLHEMCLEHARKTIYGFLEARGIAVSTPRQAVKEAAKHELISTEKVWHRAFNRKNLVYFLYTEKVEKEITEDIQQRYYPMYAEFYETIQQHIKK
ncbi:hypothetical protein FPQ10_10615 [Allobacillus sp. SKP2-8]|uniref:nucleotidyltransferase substrate binding protein n=1 Tax=unclassified Allobacillus TaxID=2628859 RepID=UPI0011823688|nr:nucleotidyltransferase substrate binding protein [Allobacillus sp. SKP2-8]TSJ65026.1 hypothetical protein FPQ10_10615 [Allobacillus sp. SKP2-8]